MMSKRRSLPPPVVIVAAPRSGTNMLRDLLCEHPELVTWPCDEINAIWRYRNCSHGTDELTPDHATKEVRAYIRRRFERLSSARGGRTVVEKTCANALRVPFVDAILPDAKYIHLIRDGRDAAASARRRWSMDESVGYLMRKARYLPLHDAPFHVGRFLGNRVYRVREKRFKVWGPEFQGLQVLLSNRTLIEVCGEQWRRCVESASSAFEEIPSDRVLDVRYETFVRDPMNGLREILEFCGLDLEVRCLSLIHI